MAIELRNPHELLPHERFSIARAFLLMLKMAVTGSFTTPILIDRNSSTILDGHHRSAACRWLGLSLVPCVSIDYLADDSISVLPRRADIPVDKRTVVDIALRGERYPRKTTRHVYQPISFTPIALSALRHH